MGWEVVGVWGETGTSRGGEREVLDVFLFTALFMKVF